MKLHVCYSSKNKNACAYPTDYLLDGWQKTRVGVTECKADEAIVKGR